MGLGPRARRCARAGGRVRRVGVRASRDRRRAGAARNQGTVRAGRRRAGRVAPAKGAHDECRGRVRGPRRVHGPSAYLWKADPDAHAQILAAGERWCRGRGMTGSLRVGTLEPVTVEPGEAVLDRMREAVEARIHVEFYAVTAGEFRSVAARPWSGGVSLLKGGAWVEAGRWEAPLRVLTSLPREHADHVAYGFVRRGWAVDGAVLRDRLAYDWPERAEREPRGIGFTPHA